MTTRSQAFHDWMLSQYPLYKPSDDSMGVRVAWNVWKAATERAAKVCANYADVCSTVSDNYGADAADWCDAAIRGLK